MKQTRQRERILEVIRESHVHMTADEVYQELKKEEADIGVATVYRNVKYLYEHRLINRIKHPDFGYVYDGNLHPHDHFHCQKCNQMFDLDHSYQKELDRQIEAIFGGQVYQHMTIFVGVCPKCLAKKSKEQN